MKRGENCISFYCSQSCSAKKSPGCISMSLELRRHPASAMSRTSFVKSSCATLRINTSPNAAQGGLHIWSGLSESGKSSVAEAFCSHYGTGQAFRANVDCFNNLPSNRCKTSVYGMPERYRALCLLHELERFSNDHHWLRLITIESVHHYLIA